MAHYRKTLRDAIKAALATALPAVKVGGARTRPWNKSDLPAIEVSTPVGNEALISDDGDIERSVAAQIRIIWGDNADPEDGCDAIAEAIETVMFGLDEPYSIRASGSEFDAGTDSGEARYANLNLTFEMRGFADWSTPQNVQ